MIADTMTTDQQTADAALIDEAARRCLLLTQAVESLSCVPDKPDYGDDVIKTFLKIIELENLLIRKAVAACKEGPLSDIKRERLEYEIRSMTEIAANINRVIPKMLTRSQLN